MLSIFIGLIFSALILNLNVRFVLSLSALIYPFIDEGFTAKVDSFNFLTIWFCIFLARLNIYFSPLIGLLLFLSKGYFSVISFLILFFSFFSQNRSKTLFLILSSIIPGLVFSYIYSNVAFSKWLLDETIVRFFGSQDINPSPWYYYLVKLLSYFPVNVIIFFLGFYQKQLSKNGRKHFFIFLVLVFLLSLSYGKRANYLLPFWPLIFLGTRDLLVYLLREKRVTMRYVLNISHYVVISVFFIFSSLLLTSLSEVIVGIHKLDVILSIVKNNTLPFWLIITWIVSLFFIYQKPFERLVRTLPFVYICLSAFQHILGYNSKYVLYDLSFPEECHKIAVKKHPRNENLDVLLFKHKGQLVNSFQEQHNCILVDHNQKEFSDGKDYLLKTDQLAIFKIG